MSTLAQFASRMKVRAKELDEGVDKIVKRTSLIADQALVMGTPVDTGRARSNWQVGIDASVKGVREPFSSGKALGIGEGANSGAAIAHAEQVISTRKSKQDIHIVNNLSYIGRLNDGHSAQAPAGFVERAVQQAVSAARQSKVFK